MPAPERGVCALALRCAGRSILFDCGEATQLALRREKVSPIKIDLIALTHYHGDHVFGLPGLLQTMNCLKRTEPLTITGPEGLEEALAPILQMVGQTDYAIRLHRLSAPRGEPMRLFHPKWPKGAVIAPVPTEHRVPSQGYSFILGRSPVFLAEKAKSLGIPVSLWRQIQDADPESPICVNGEPLRENNDIVRGVQLMGGERKGLHVLFTGDTQPCESVFRAARHADLLIHDATYGEDGQADEAALWGHSTFRQAAEIADRAGVGRLWLTHFSQSMRNPENYLPNASAVFPNTVCGHDGLTLTLDYDRDPA